MLDLKPIQERCRRSYVGEGRFDMIKDVDALIAEVERLRAENERMAEALRDVQKWIETDAAHVVRGSGLWAKIYRLLENLKQAALSQKGT